MNLKQTVLTVTMLIAWLSGNALAGEIVLSPDQFSILAGGNFSAAKTVTVHGTVGAGGNIWLGKNGQYDSHVLTGSSLWTGQGVNIDGDVVTQDTTTPNTWDPITRTSPGFSAGSTNVSISKGSDNNLAAGDYGRLTAGKNATVHLTAGTYNFTSVVLDKNVRVSSDGSVIINVLGDFTAGRDVILDHTGNGAFSILSGEKIYLGKNVFADVDNLFAFDGNIRINQHSQVTGSVYASNDIFLDKDVTIGMQESAGVPSPASLTMICTGAAVCLTRRRRRPKRV